MKFNYTRNTYRKHGFDIVYGNNDRSYIRIGALGWVETSIFEDAVKLIEEEYSCQFYNSFIWEMLSHANAGMHKRIYDDTGAALIEEIWDLTRFKWITCNDEGDVLVINS